MRQKIEAPKFMASRLLRAARAEPFDKRREGGVVNYGYFNRRAGLAALASVVSLFGTIQAANAADGGACSMVCCMAVGFSLDAEGIIPRAIEFVA